MRNSLKNILLVVFVSIISLGLYQYYQNYKEARSFNNFLDSAALVSSLHLEASEEFKNLLDFSEISREEFENKIDKVVANSKEAYEIINGRIGSPIKAATLIGDGPSILKEVSMVGNDMMLDPGIGTCGKAGQGVPVGVAQPSILINKMTVGGTKL